MAKPRPKGAASILHPQPETGAACTKERLASKFRRAVRKSDHRREAAQRNKGTTRELSNPTTRGNPAAPRVTPAATQPHAPPTRPRRNTRTTMPPTTNKWYVGQVLAGKEAQTLAQCRRLLDPEVLHDSFVPEFESMFKRADGWRAERRLLFPGYVFLVTDDIDRLAAQLVRVPNRVRVLGDEENSYIPLTPDERDWFLAFVDQDHVVRMSEGIIENSQVRVTRGPLMGMEGRIQKIDRHKRTAFLALNMFGRTMRAKVGLEILRKV